MSPGCPPAKARDFVGSEDERVPTVSEAARATAPWLIDVLLAIAVALALTLIVATGTGGERRPDAGAFVFAVGLGALMLLRRRMTRTVLVLSVLAVFAYYTLDYSPIGVAVPVFAALLSAAEAGLMGWSIGAALVVFVVSMYYRVRDGVEAIGFLLGYESVSNLALFAAAIAIGYGIRARRVRAAQQAEIAELTASQLAREAEARLQGERERISRELHDTVGHTLSVISLQAGVGADAVGCDDDAVRGALDRIRGASTHSLTDLRSMVRLLRSAGSGDDTRSVHSLAAVPELVRTAAGAGIAFTTDISVEPSELSSPVDAAAYRVIQESITNVVRHAGATHARVDAHLLDGDLRITVSDDGRGAAADEGSGYGMVGMTERVRLLGGTLITRSSPADGFTIDVRLPARLR